MTIPVLMLQGFAAWTLLLLAVTVGVYRWSRIFGGRARISGFRSDQFEGEAWYQRSVRAHANCIENLPVFGAIVVGLEASGVDGAAVDWLCALVLTSRVAQSLVHVSHAQTDAFVAMRFSLYSMQMISFLALIALLVHHTVLK